MKFKTKCLSLFFGITIINSAGAQSGFVTTGGNTSNASGSVSSSVGQIDYVYSASNDGSISQGIQQSYIIEDISSLTEVNDISVSIYPNPTTDILKIEFKEIVSDYSIKLYNNLGKLIEHIQINELITEIKMTDLSSAFYSLEVMKNNEKLKIYNIIKN